MFKKILVLYDLSESSKHALEWAINAGNHFTANVKVLYVIDRYLRANPANLVRESKEIADLISQEIDRDVRDFLGTETEKQLHSIDIEATCGYPVSLILHTLKADSYDLVVMGTHGRTGLKHMALGSLAEKIVRHSPVPVLIAKRPPSNEMKQILVPIDFSDYAEEALQFAIPLLGSMATSLDLVHSVSVVETMAPIKSKLMGVIDVEALKKIAHDELSELAAKYPSIPMGLHVGVGPPAQAILEMADKIRADLIVMPTHGHTGISHFLIGSTSEQVVRYARCDVLSFCPKRQAEYRTEIIPDYRFLPDDF